MSGYHLWVKYKIRKKGEIEPQEVFLDQLAKKEEEKLGISEKKFEIPLSRKILKTFFVFIFLILLFFLGRTFQLQILDANYFSAAAEKNKFIIRSLQTGRGVIYDQNGEQIVFNKSSFDLVLDKEKLPKTEEGKKKVLEVVSKIINKNIDESDSVVVAENLDHQKLILLETKIEELPGFEIRQNLTREYKNGSLFSHIIGYTGRITSEELKEKPDVYSNLDYIGRSGLEKTNEEILKRSSGKIRYEKDALGNLISQEVISLPESGRSLSLWLDSGLQKKIEETLKNILKAVGSEKAMAVAINPKNGGVLSLVSLPSFDNNVFNKGSDQQALKNILSDPKEPLFNRAISGLYPTGSTIKPLLASAALQEKIIPASKSIDCQGKITIPNRYDPELIEERDDWRTHGLTDMRKAIAESCNVYFYTIGGGYKNQQGLGPSRIKKYLELYNWGSKTGIDLTGEAKGFIPSPEWKEETKKENWWDGDTYNLSIGQGDILITPLQVAVSFAAIANNGTIYKPKIVKEIVDDEKNVVEEIKPEIIRENFINPEYLKVVREGMRQAVTGENSPFASSVLLNSLPVPVAAKTGTAQTPKPDYYHNWITVFAPYDDPQIVLTVMIESVKGLQPAALPAAKEILNWYFSQPRGKI